MKRRSDSEYARYLLELRESECSFRFHFRRLVRANLIIVVIVAIAIAIYVSVQIWEGVYLMLGVLLGKVMRDVGWIFAMQRAWPFNLNVTDWERVRSLAAEEPSD